MLFVAMLRPVRRNRLRYLCAGDRVCSTVLSTKYSEFLKTSGKARVLEQPGGFVRHALGPAGAGRAVAGARVFSGFFNLHIASPQAPGPRRLCALSYHAGMAIRDTTSGNPGCD